VVLLWPFVSAKSATVIKSTYFDYDFFNACQNNAACQALFSPVPSGKVLLIQRVSCLIAVGPSPRYVESIELQRLTSGTLKGREFLTVPLANPELSTRVYLLNHATMLAIPENQWPAIHINLDSVGYAHFNCTIHGELNDLMPAAAATAGR
jgi:hypothetical protein